MKTDSDQAVAVSQQRVDAERQMICDARKAGKFALLGAFVKLSGPGWLQSAITLGGGSLAGALYLGVVGGYSLLWVQFVAIVFGVIMLCAISYASLSTGERPFKSIGQHINPVLAWGWALATLAANMVWSLPQFSLATAVVQQNLLPGAVGADSAMGDNLGKATVCGFILVIAVSIVWVYDSGGRGIRIFDTLLKIMVALIVLSFFGVVISLAVSEQGLPWGEIAAGFVPDLTQWSRPATSFEPYIAAAGEAYRPFWNEEIVTLQRNVMIAAIATAVGINMTFLLPYSMLNRGWDKEFRGMAIFDLSTGMAVPFVLVTSCVVIASASQFHTKADTALMAMDPDQPASQLAGYEDTLKKRLKEEIGPEEFATLSENPEQLKAALAALPESDKQLSAMIVKRDAFALAQSLEPLMGKQFANIVFGIGVLGMAVSTIIILMLISGFVICEMLDLPQGGMTHRLGCMAATVGALGPFIWQGKTQFWLAVPTSVFGMALLPIAYITFLLMMNSQSLLGDERPQGLKRVWWNLCMIVATGFATAAASWSVWSSAHWYGVAGVAVFVVLALFTKARRPALA